MPLIRVYFDGLAITDVMRQPEKAGGTPAPRHAFLEGFTPPAPILPAELSCRGELPQLYRDGGNYSVAFRLLDAVRGAGVSPAVRSISRLAEFR
jgi:hypothetical protein